MTETVNIQEIYYAIMLNFVSLQRDREPVYELLCILKCVKGGEHSTCFKRGSNVLNKVPLNITEHVGMVDLSSSL